MKFSKNRLVKMQLCVAPARERGLKWIACVLSVLLCRGRSREGAWIEIVGAHDPATLQYGRSREGAWIEILS